MRFQGGSNLWMDSLLLLPLSRYSCSRQVKTKAMVGRICQFRLWPIIFLRASSNSFSMILVKALHPSRLLSLWLEPREMQPSTCGLRPFMCLLEWILYQLFLPRGTHKCVHMAFAHVLLQKPSNCLSLNNIHNKSRQKWNDFKPEEAP